MSKQNTHWLVWIDNNPDEIPQLKDIEFYIWNGKRPSLKDKESILDKLGYSCYLNDIREFPKDRTAILNEVVQILPITSILK